MTGETVICAGHVNWDVTLYVDRLPSPDGEAVIADQMQSGGGSASNTAVVLAGLGLDSVLLGSVGVDDYGSRVRQELTETGVNCTYLETVSDGVTTLKYLVVDETGQVMVLANDGANEAYDETSLPETALEAASHLHLTGQRPSTASRLAKRARSVGVPVSFDPGRRLHAREYEAVYRHADTVFLNETEAEAAREQRLFEEWDGVMVIKRGNDGACAFCEDRKQVSHSGFSVDAVDTAGAGDAFAAGFIATRLDGGALERALAVGNACGAIATRSGGARTEISWEDVEKALERER